MPGSSLGPIDRGAGAVAEDERGRPVGRVGHVGEPLDADDQHVLRRCRRGSCRRPAPTHVAEARRRRPRCRRPPAGVAPSSVGDRGGDGRGLVQVGHRRDDHGVDLRGVDAGRLQRLARPPRRDIIWTVSSAAAQRRSTMPERVRIHSSVESIWSRLGVGDHAARPVAADAQDARRARRRSAVRDASAVTRRVDARCRGAAAPAAGRGRPGRRPRPATRRRCRRAARRPAISSRRFFTTPIGVPAAARCRPRCPRPGELALAGRRRAAARSGCRDRARATVAVLVDEVARVVELVGGVEGEHLDALEIALGDARPGCRRAASPGGR